jgi:hypothetical protein
MNFALRTIENARQNIRPNLALLILLCLHSILCCASLIKTADYQDYMLYDPARFYSAAVVVAVFSLFSLLFVLARFSFGYFVGFYFYTMVLGFLWLEHFSKFQYNFTLAGVSATSSALLFLLPALLIGTPVKQAFSLSTRTFERVLGFILVLAMAAIVCASSYSFRLVSLGHIYDFRSQLNFPSWLGYLIGIVSDTLLPFAFACYFTLNYRWRAVAVILLMALFYPITLSKFAFFAPIWILTLLVFSRFFEPRISVVLSLFLPMAVGVILIVWSPLGEMSKFYFGTVNIRMIATPSGAMDVYNDFFSSHPLTYFCQISFLKPLMACAYPEQISVVMEKQYALGAFNASLFATEGIASAGSLFAPLTALACGFVIALGNRASADLPSRFVLISGALLPQAFLNVPLTTVMLTHGAAILFLLWYITPRALFEQKPPKSDRHPSGIA